MNNLIKKYQENIKYIEQKEKEIENSIKPLWQDNIDKDKADLILFAKDVFYGIKIDNGAYKYELEKISLKDNILSFNLMKTFQDYNNYDNEEVLHIKADLDNKCNTEIYINKKFNDDPIFLYNVSKLIIDYINIDIPKKIEEVILSQEEKIKNLNNIEQNTETIINELIIYYQGEQSILYKTDEDETKRFTKDIKSEEQFVRPPFKEEYINKNTIISYKVIKNIFERDLY